MAMTNAQIEKKLRQHDNEIVAIYDMLAAIRGTVDQHTTMLTAIQGRLSSHDARLEGHDTRFDTIDARFDRIDTRLDTIDTRLDTIDGALAEILRRLPEAS